MSFNRNLKIIREQKGMTQKELAALLSVSMASVIAYEQAQKKPSFDMLIAIAEKLNVSLDMLCDLDIKPQTWSDVARRVVALDVAGGCNGHIEFERKEGKTCAIVFYGWVSNVPDEDGWRHENTEPDNNYQEFQENPLAKFANEYLKMRDLHNSGAIDEELFAMWLSKTYKALDYSIAGGNTYAKT